MAFVPSHSLLRSPAPRRSAICSMKATSPQTSPSTPPPSPASHYSIVKTVLPADTDYSFNMWHGNYIRWLEEARVMYLAEINFPFEQLVKEYQIDLIVRDINVRYKTPARLGEDIEVTVRLENFEKNKVRLSVKSDFVRVSDRKQVASADITVVPVSTETGKIKREWPPLLKDAFFQ